MSAESNKAFIRRYLDALSGKPKSASLVDEFVADERLKAHIAQAEAAFPGYELVAEDMIAEGNKVAVRATGYVVHNGDFMGLPPTGRRATLPGILIYEIEGGKIVDHWMQFDWQRLMRQLTEEPVAASVG